MLSASKSQNITKRTFNKIEDEHSERKKNENSTYEEKKMMKQMLAKTLREELGGVLDSDMLK